MIDVESVKENLTAENVGAVLICIAALCLVSLYCALCFWIGWSLFNGAALPLYFKLWTYISFVTLIPAGVLGGIILENA